LKPGETSRPPQRFLVTMKLLPFFFLLALLSACSSSDSTQTTGESTPASPRKATVVFLDKSLSVNQNQAFVTAKYQRILREVIQENIQRKGDRLEVYFVHENTAKAKALELVSQSELEDQESANATDREAAQTAYELAIQKERARFQQQALAQLEAPNPSKSNQYTDLRASLGALNELAGEGYAVQVYYFSDMVESMPGSDRRDFHTTPPASEQQADEWARTDAAALRDELPNLSSVVVRLVLPFEPTSSTVRNNPTVTRYWNTLFRELGVTQTVRELY
jgi:hypothetical protein